MSIVARSVGKVIGHPPNRVLSDITLEIRDGEFVALTGRSGAGKSTLLYVLSSLDPVSSGTVEIAGRDISRMREEELCRFRNELMGFVFQFHYLIAELSALENVLLPSRKTGQEAQRIPYAKRLLEQFGLADKFQRLPRELSGGEQQRVAIARALVMEPKYLFADEPTGNLDSVNGETVMNIIRETNKHLGTTIIMVTHDPHYASLARRQIQLADGQLVTPPQ
jgi:putative ABC transport system ATP-binding protein/lipoprotein-releasing system ATP-binding protein